MCVLFRTASILGMSLEQFSVHTLMPLLLVLISFALIYFLLAWAKRKWVKKFREPFHQELLRPPGWGCIKRREDALFNIASITVCLPCLWAAAALLAMHAPRPALIGYLFVMIITTVCLARALSRDIKKARTAYMGMFGEWAVAECLTPLTHSGWHVFHDFFIDTTDKPFNIDHIVIGPSGIFAIETKACSKPANEAPGGNNAKVDGEIVHLASGHTISPLKQAKRQATFLRDWLNSKGVDIKFIHPVVVLPGWTVSYKTHTSSRAIRDTLNLVSYLQENPDRPSPEKINAATTAIEKHCRSLKFADVGF